MLGLYSRGLGLLPPLVFLERTFTTEYSMKAAKTNTRQVAIQTSIALVRDTDGMFRFTPELWVVMVRMVRIPREILAGTASMSIQKDTQDRMTTRRLGR